MTPTPDLRQLLADAREDATTFRRYGQAELAGAIEQLLDRLIAVPQVRQLLTWHDEAGALLLSGRGASYFRARRADWEARGLAERVARGRWRYCELVIPRKPNLDEARADAERTAREDVAA